jgi:SAM-dependent methyltransferase
MRKLKDDFSARSKLKEIGRWYVTRFVENVARSLPSGSLMLDRDLDCIDALNTLPFKIQAFDAIPCIQTLEHLEWPRESVQECFRVLNLRAFLYPLGWGVVARK